MLTLVGVLPGSQSAWNQTLTTTATVSEIKIHWAETLKFLEDLALLGVKYCCLVLLYVSYVAFNSVYRCFLDLYFEISLCYNLCLCASVLAFSCPIRAQYCSSGLVYIVCLLYCRSSSQELQLKISPDPWTHALQNSDECAQFL